MVSFRFERYFLFECCKNTKVAVISHRKFYNRTFKQQVTRLDHLIKINYSLLSTKESHLNVFLPESNQDCPNDCHDSKAQVSPIFETNLNLDKFLGAMKMGGVNLGVAKAANISVTRSR